MTRPVPRAGEIHRLWSRDLSRTPGLHWPISILFMVGASLFALGSLPPYWRSTSNVLVGLTFVLGALAFTAAAYGQYLEVVNSSTQPGDTGMRKWAWTPSDRAWWAVAVQLIGTLLFNLNTIDSLLRELSVAETNRLVWAPDIFGSIAFLIASHLSWTLLDGHRRRLLDDTTDWWIAVLNYCGSLLFFISALGAFTLPTGDLRSVTAVNGGTFLGAVCFFASSFLLLPPRVPATN